MDIRLSDAERVFIMHGAQNDLRNDGRSCPDYRPCWVERGVLSTTDGSARVRIGTTDVLAGVKCELVQCDDSSRECDRLIFHVDCSANASPQFIGRGGDEFATELSDALQLAYDNAHALPDILKLILTPNHYWKLYIDVVILQCGGAIIDAVSIAAKAALYDTEIVNVVTRQADEKKMAVDLPSGYSTWTLDVKKAPLIVSVTKVGQANVLDATMEEEECAFASLWIGVISEPSSDSLVTMCRQANGGSLDASSVEDMIQLALSAARTLDGKVLKWLPEIARGIIAGQTFLS